MLPRIPSSPFFQSCKALLALKQPDTSVEIRVISGQQRFFSHQLILSFIIISVIQILPLSCPNKSGGTWKGRGLPRWQPVCPGHLHRKPSCQGTVTTPCQTLGRIRQENSHLKVHISLENIFPRHPVKEGRFLIHHMAHFSYLQHNGKST